MLKFTISESARIFAMRLYYGRDDVKICHYVVIPDPIGNPVPFSRLLALRKRNMVRGSTILVL
jgi:hypothetical protein